MRLVNIFADEPILGDFVFNPFGVNSLLVQAVEYVTNKALHEPIDSRVLAQMSIDLNRLIEQALEPYDSPHLLLHDFNFRFKSVQKPTGENVDYKSIWLQVLDKDGKIMLEWKN
jgi:hypothetical protein